MTSPIGRTAKQSAIRRQADSAAYRDAHRAHARAAALAKQVIHLRTELGLTQEQLAAKVGTSHSAISRLESGRHDVKNDTLHRVFTALGVTPVLGYQVAAKNGRPARVELIPV